MKASISTHHFLCESGYLCECRPEIEKILRALPSKTTRQTLLFSATFPQDIQELSQFALRPNFNLVDTVGEDSTHSSAQVSETMFAIQNFAGFLTEIMSL